MAGGAAVKEIVQRLQYIAPGGLKEWLRVKRDSFEMNTEIR
jgi:hypothetical protein